jgi:hypothetical protein
MGAVAAGLESEIGPVIEQKGDAPPLSLRTQRVHGTRDRIVIDILETQLHAGDVAAVEGLGEQLGKGRQIVDAGRRDQIKAAGGRNDGTSGL